MEYTLNLIGPDDHEELLVGPTRVPMETFIQHFQWDESRYPLRMQLVSMVEVINKVSVGCGCDWGGRRAVEESDACVTVKLEAP